MQQVISIVGAGGTLVEYDDNSKNKILEALKVAAGVYTLIFWFSLQLWLSINDISISGGLNISISR